MNKVILMGRLTRDPEVRYSQGEQATAVARYTLAVDRRGRNQENSADFIACVAFGKAAEFAERYLHKGTKIVLTGRIQTGSYTNKDGQRVYTTDIVAEDQEFAESKNTATVCIGGRRMKQYTLNRKTYKDVKRMDHQQLDAFCKNLYKAGHADGMKDAEGLTEDEVREVILGVKGIGPKKAEDIVSALTAAQKERS